MFFLENDSFEKALKELGNSSSLPGGLQVVKRVLRVLSTPRRGILSKLDGAFDIADAVKKYTDQLARDTDYEVEHDIDYADLWLENHDCFPVADGNVSAQLIREIIIPCVKNLPRKKIKIKDDEGKYIFSEIYVFQYEVDGV